MFLILNVFYDKHEITKGNHWDILLDCSEFQLYLLKLRRHHSSPYNQTNANSKLTHPSFSPPEDEGHILLKCPEQQG